MVHVVLVRGVYAGAIEGGRKRVEARLSLSRQAPWGKVSTGDTLWFRRVGGGYVGRAVVTRVTSRGGLTPAAVRRLGRCFSRRVGATSAFWEERRHARYATLVEFEGFEASSAGPVLKKRAGDRRSWIVMGIDGEVAGSPGGRSRAPGRAA